VSDAPRAAGAERRHYSYTHYADPAVARDFEVRRFGGPIGRLLLETQAAILRDALAPLAGRFVLDVGTGTGRAALGLASEGARVVGVDASREMLLVALDRAAEAGRAVRFGQADAHQLPFADRSVDAAVCLRVLMHAVDWRATVTELCRVARWRVVVDFPALPSLAALESGGRRLAQAAGRPVEAYRVMSVRAVTRAFYAHGFRVVSAHRQFVLPIALHKAVGSIALTASVERALSLVGMRRLFGSPVTMVAER
jgi:SAM-dependent methyltransferase